MVQPGPLPERIEPDAILEALVELRFEHTETPELMLGRLMDVELWSDYEPHRLPSADIPQPIRDMNPDLRYQPTFELRKGNQRVVKIGSNVLSYHVVGNSYPGWQIFKAEIEDVLRQLVAKLKSPQINRIGFRYINILRPEQHHVSSLTDTNVSLRVGNRSLTDSLVVNYVHTISATHAVTVRIATPDLVAGPVEPGFSLLCDIDVATVSNRLITSYDDAMSWIDKAHDIEKEEFFSLLPAEVTEKLAAKGKGSENG